MPDETLEEQIAREEERQRREYEAEIRSLLRRTPEVRTKERLLEMFGPDWKGASRSQKAGRALTGLGQILSGGKGVRERILDEETEQYKVVAPALGREQAVLSAENRARISADTAERNRLLREKIEQRMAEQGGIALELKKTIADRDWEKTQALIDKMTAETENLRDRWPKNEVDFLPYITRKMWEDPEGAQIEWNIWLQMQAAKGALKPSGGGAGGSTRVTEGTQNVLVDIGGRLQAVPLPTRSVSQSFPAGGPRTQANVMEILRSLGTLGQLPGGGVGGMATAPDALAQPAPPAQPGQQLQQMIQPDAAQTPTAPRTPVTPSAPTAPGKNAPLGVIEFPQGAARPGEDARNRDSRLRSRMYTYSLAKSLPLWAAAGDMEDYTGGVISGSKFLEWARRIADTAPDAQSLSNLVMTKGTLSDINVVSGLAFSIKEIDLVKDVWPVSIETPQSITQRVVLLGYAMGTEDYLRANSLSALDLAELPGIFDLVKRGTRNIVNKTVLASSIRKGKTREVSQEIAKKIGIPITAESLTTKGKVRVSRDDWRKFAPTEAELDPMLPAKIAVARLRAKRAREGRQ